MREKITKLKNKAIQFRQNETQKKEIFKKAIHQWIVEQIYWNSESRIEYSDVSIIEVSEGGSRGH